MQRQALFQLTAGPLLRGFQAGLQGVCGQRDRSTVFQLPVVADQAEAQDCDLSELVGTGCGAASDSAGGR